MVGVLAVVAVAVLCLLSPALQTGSEMPLQAYACARQHTQPNECIWGVWVLFACRCLHLQFQKAIAGICKISVLFKMLYGPIYMQLAGCEGLPRP